MTALEKPVVTEVEATGCQVVGLDGSPSSNHALLWASEHADALGPVQPISAWHYPWWAAVPTDGQLVPPSRERLQAVAEISAGHMLDDSNVSGTKDPIAVHGSPGPVLVDAGGEANLLVVGTRGRAAATAQLLGSVSAHCVHHSMTPVAIVPSTAVVDDRYRRVVVGVDGSANSASALAWALVNTPANSLVKVVNAWHNDATLPEVAVAAQMGLRAQSKEILGQVVADARALAPDTDRSIQTASREGDPRRVLDEEAERADLLVLGARGHGRLAHLLLGSVTSSLVHRPATTTIVVRRS